MQNPPIARERFCRSGKRPDSITFTAYDYGSGQSETQTVSGKAACRAGELTLSPSPELDN